MFSAMPRTDFKPFSLLQVPECPLWVRHALRLFAKRERLPLGMALEHFLEHGVPEDVRTLAHGHARRLLYPDRAALRSDRLPTRADFRARAWAAPSAPGDPGTGTAPAGLAEEEEETHFAPIRLAPGEEA